MTIQAALFAPLARRAILTALAVLAGFNPEVCLPQTYPSAPIRIVVPYPAAGGPLDTAARVVADEKRASPSGRLGSSRIARAPAAASVPNPYFVRRPMGTRYCAGRKRCSPWAIFFSARQRSMRVNSSRSACSPNTRASWSRAPRLPVTSPAELIAFARANPGKLSYGSQGVGTLGHLSFEQIKLPAAQIDAPCMCRFAAACRR